MLQNEELCDNRLNFFTSIEKKNTYHLYYSHLILLPGKFPSTHIESVGQRTISTSHRKCGQLNYPQLTPKVRASELSPPHTESVGQ